MEPISAATAASADPRRSLPGVDELLRMKEADALLRLHPRPLVLEAIRATLDKARDAVARDEPVPTAAVLWPRVEAAIREADFDRVRPVVNATGILLHTGLGRAVLPAAAAKRLACLDRCVNLQIDLDTGLRGKRGAMNEALLRRLTGAEAALVVNNNAAATLLALAALCADREAIVSRGQLIEIGGSFRLPDCIRQSGARLVEVGTTNKTHLRDYEAALTEQTGAVLRVNPSNYRIVGFSSSVSVADLVTLKAKKSDLIVIDDLGSGALTDPRQYGLPAEPTVGESIAAGADLVLFSGDKLIGGPQSGILAGRRDLVQRIRKHPLTRMLRVDKLTEVALQETLRLFLDPETLPARHPTLRMLTRPVPDLVRVANGIRRRVARRAPGLEVDVRQGESAVGGGSFPGHPVPTVLLAVRKPGWPPEKLARQLRRHEPPVIARIGQDRVLLDMRTLLEGDADIVVSALAGLLSFPAI